MRFFLLSLLILTAWAGEAEPPKLPADVQSAIDKATKSIDAAQAKADAEILKQRQALIKELTKLQESYTKKGNLDVALAIKARVDEETTAVEKSVMGTLPQPKSDQWILGIWQVNAQQPWLVEEKGKISSGTRTGTWKLDNKNFIVQWGNGVTETFDVDGPTDTMNGTSSYKNTPLKATKTK